jgi:lysyl-tRNA synthetase, class II
VEGLRVTIGDVGCIKIFVHPDKAVPALKLIHSHVVKFAAGDCLVSVLREAAGPGHAAGSEILAVFFTVTVRGKEARHDGLAAGHTDGRGSVGSMKNGGRSRQPIKMRRAHDGVSGKAQAISPVLIGHEKENVRRTTFHFEIRTRLNEIRLFYIFYCERRVGMKAVFCSERAFFSFVLMAGMGLRRLLASMEELSELLAIRRAKVDKLRELGVDPFGGTFSGVMGSQVILGQYAEDLVVRYAGRVVSHRDMGKSHFLHLQDEQGSLQIYVQTKNLSEKEQQVFQLIDLGDFIGVDGTLFTTKTGEKSIKVSALTFLSKALKPLPGKWHGLADTEQRYRQRYLDMISHPEVKSVLQMRSLIIREIRRFMEGKGFMEVETPMMQAIPGGAAAQPFLTHHKALGIPLYLRIAPELYLKRLLVGGMEKVFELNRNFRNEGISRKHNPEFTMLEAYWAYADFEGMADLVEEMVTSLALQFKGSEVLRHEQKNEAGEVVTEKVIDLRRPWKRKRYQACLEEVAGADFFALSVEQRRQRVVELGVELSPQMEDFEVVNQAFEKLVEARTVDPLFVTHLPKELVPLARQNRDNPDLVDVYELIINGQEISPGYTELNDPMVQRERLENQAGGETQKLDEDFLTALEHGMPPAGGLGIGIDRLVMMLTGAESIRDVLLFPLMKPKE